MDGVSSAASVIAIATVAVQLADGMKKLCEFWSSIKEAPDDIHSIATGLGMLSASLTEIAHEAELQQPDPTLTRVLKECSVEVNLLTSIVDDFEPGFASSSSRVRRWTALKAVFKTEKLKKFRDFLDSTKTTLLLIQGNHSR
ncbi:hypothetical protein MMC12_003375 [Toensbergia leucococca]|nr:hypothetical protein [Toensbergia leucococca]